MEEFYPDVMQDGPAETHPETCMHFLNADEDLRSALRGAPARKAWPATGQRSSWLGLAGYSQLREAEQRFFRDRRVMPTR